MTWSEWRTQARSRRATSISSSSPAAWPSVSLMTLKRSRSISSSAQWCPCGAPGPARVRPARSAGGGWAGRSGRRSWPGGGSVFGDAAVGHVLHDAGVADAWPCSLNSGSASTWMMRCRPSASVTGTSGQHRRRAASCSTRSKAALGRAPCAAAARRPTGRPRHEAEDAQRLGRPAGQAANCCAASRSCPCGPDPGRAPAWPCCVRVRCACATHRSR
jgi:hypothetical protein